jgi:hypothetical protein
MTEINELPNEVVDDWVMTYLKYRLNENEELSNPVSIIESLLYYARDNLIDRGIEEKDPDMINQAKTINSLVNILRGQPSVNYWNGCLKDRGLPINELIYP